MFNGETYRHSSEWKRDQKTGKRGRNGLGIDEKNQNSCQQIEEITKIETRTTVLGHVQRGGSPLAGDRVLATAFGHAAVEVLMAGHRGRLVVMKSGTINHIDLTEIAGKQRLVPIDHPLVRAARDVGTSFGN